MSEDRRTAILRILADIQHAGLRDFELEHYANAIEAAFAAPTSGKMGADSEPVRLTYRNWRGEVSERTITPIRVFFGSTEWHPEPQWLLEAFDHGKQANRDFALRDFATADALPTA